MTILVIIETMHKQPPDDPDKKSKTQQKALTLPLNTAKARFCELVRAAGSGKSITVTYFGIPTAKIVPYSTVIPETLTARFKSLAAAGQIRVGTISKAKKASLKRSIAKLTHKNGALKDFLDTRNRF